MMASEENSLEITPLWNLITFYENSTIVVSGKGDDSSYCGTVRLPCHSICCALTHLSLTSTQPLSFSQGPQPCLNSLSLIRQHCFSLWIP
jgi:hypothetical protein